MTNFPKDDDDASTNGEAGPGRAGNGRDEGATARDDDAGGSESSEAAGARIDAENTRTADWWLAQPPEALRELAEDFERLRGLQKIFGFGACGVLRKKLTRKVDRLFRLTAMAVCDVD